VNITVEY